MIKQIPVNEVINFIKTNYTSQQIKNVFQTLQIKKAHTLNDFQANDRQITRLILKQIGFVNISKGNKNAIGQITNQLKNYANLQVKYFI